MKSVPNVVLVHGAWADGSCWSGVIQRLQAAGYNVTAVQLPENSLAEDIARTRRVLAEQTGPTLLVGHSYGGAVITNIGKDAPNVVGLVYVAAFAPDEGETLQQLAGSGPPTPALVNAHPDKAGYIYLSEENYVKHFASDVDPVQARVMFATQQPLNSTIFGAVFGPPAWKYFPSWYLVSKNDEAIPPDGERFMARRMGATVSEIAASHVSMVSHPDEVTNLIETAASSLSPDPQLNTAPTTTAAPA